MLFSLKKRRRWLWGIVPAILMVWIFTPAKIERVSPDGVWTARVTYTQFFWGQVVVWVQKNRTGQSSNRFFYEESLIGPHPFDVIWSTDSRHIAYNYKEDIASSTARIYDVGGSPLLKESEQDAWLKQQLPAHIKEANGEERDRLVALLERLSTR